MSYHGKEEMNVFVPTSYEFQDLYELYVEIMMDGGCLWGARPEEPRGGFQGLK